MWLSSSMLLAADCRLANSLGLASRPHAGSQYTSAALASRFIEAGADASIRSVADALGDALAGRRSDHARSS